MVQKNDLSIWKLEGVALRGRRRMSAQDLGGGARLHRCNVQSGAITATERRVWRSRGLLAAVFSERSCIGMGGSRTAVAEVLRDPNELAYRPPRTSGGFRPSSLISASDYDLDPASSKPGYEVKPANQAASHQVACGGSGVLACPHTTAIHVERPYLSSCLTIDEQCANNFKNDLPSQGWRGIMPICILS
jgi:hypothetical protein